VAQAENHSTEVKMKKEKEKMTSERTKLVLSEEQKSPNWQLAIHSGLKLQTSCQR
jgi:hypothetical protein